MCEFGLVMSELNFMLKNTRRFSREKRVRTPLSQYVSRSFVKPSPKGVILIMSPWNYPFMLTIDPLVDALSAGNTAIIKPSAYAPATSQIIEKVIRETFDEQVVAVVSGGRAENQALLEQPFDHIFFTGSQNVGKEVLRKSAEHLIPATLELGGKSPCIVEKSANLALAARRIVFGKFLNCGQTCVAPDYILCDESIVDKLKPLLIKEIRRQFTETPLTNENYGKIINRKHFDRLSSLLQHHEVLYGGNTEEQTCRIEPTILDHCDWNSEIMEEEIFGPLLPVLTYSDLDHTLDLINSRPHPLALYIFSSDSQLIRHVTEICPFGGGCINDTIIHLATTQMGFGGFGSSGMGAYHGKTGFDTFSHHKSIVDKKTWIDLPMRYQPYTALYDRLIHLFLR